MDKMEFLDEKFAYNLMSIPTYSGMEEKMIDFIILWAKENNIKYYSDELNNLYLTKGELSEGEFYPCVTSHMDTVQTGHKDFIKNNKLLDIKTRINSNNKHEIYVDNTGIGGDDKCGILVSLSLFKYFDKLKAAFFVSEEIGCVGSKHMDKSFFDNIGYVIGWDSPEVNRNSWSCSGQKLFNYKFYTDHIKKICDNNNRTLFYSEAFTDVVQIRENFDIICMNFGSGGYLAHTVNEYAVLEDMDVSIKFGKELIENLGNVKYAMAKNQSSYGYFINTVYKKDENSNLIKEYVSKDENINDIESLKKLGDNNRYSNYYPSKNYSNYDDNDEEYEDDYDLHDEYAVTYIIDKYDEKIEDIKNNLELHILDISENVRKKCEILGVDYETEFKDLIETDTDYLFEEEITF